QGLLASVCANDGAVKLLGGSLNNISLNGVLADTKDPAFGTGDSYVTVSNVSMTMAPAGIGVAAIQDPTTPANHAGVTVMGNTSVSGGVAGVLAQGLNASATVKNNSAS